MEINLTECDIVYAPSTTIFGLATKYSKHVHFFSSRECFITEIISFDLKIKLLLICQDYESMFHHIATNQIGRIDQKLASSTHLAGKRGCFFFFYFIHSIMNSLIHPSSVKYFSAQGFGASVADEMNTMLYNSTPRIAT